MGFISILNSEFFFTEFTLISYFFWFFNLWIFYPLYFFDFHSFINFFNSVSCVPCDFKNDSYSLTSISFRKSIISSFSRPGYTAEIDLLISSYDDFFPPINGTQENRVFSGNPVSLNAIHISIYCNSG